jgi:hypothetical protein
VRLAAGALPLLAALLFGPASLADPGERVLDDFESQSAWKADFSDGVAATSSAAPGARGRGLRLDYDFTQGSGYAFLRRELPLDLPDNFELRFKIRGEGAPNALEIKLTDASSDNVWWHRKADYVPPGEWTTLRIKRRQIDFAWGPTENRTLRRTAAIEFVVAAGTGGGKGWIAVDDLTITPLPVALATPPPIASRTVGGIAAVDGDPATAWFGRPGDPLDLDLGFRREFGGLVLRWSGGADASDYAIQLSDEGDRWRTVREVEGSDGGVDWIRLEESEARFIRILPRAGKAARFALAEAEVQPLAFGASDNAFLAAVAAAERRGLFPRGFIGEQNYWTLVATPEGGNSGLIDESGAIEVGRGGFSVEPFLLDGGHILSWADVAGEQSLLEGTLPIPSVTWRQEGWSLVTTAYADGKGEARRLIGQYALSNTSGQERGLTLLLAVRPFQVNPPQQFLNIRGGVSPIRSVRWQDGLLKLDGKAMLFPLTAPDRIAISGFDAGMLPQALDRAGDREVDDPTGLASAALVYRVTLAAGETRTFGWAAPLGSAPLSRAPPQAPAAAGERWRKALGDVVLQGPAEAQPFFQALRTSLGHILATREGPALRPGSRAYARSWIRDGAMMSTALLRMGLTRSAEDFLLWYAHYQYDSGKVPCCVDSRGADPVPEHDSDGELIHLVAQLHRYAPDRPRLERTWPRVRAAADHIEELRQQTRVAANRTGPTRHFYGLLPPSISHEGYSAKPMHSYWDDFWALTGLKDAAWLAAALGRRGEAALLQARADSFRADILASLAAARSLHGIAFIPGAADLGDFDATSTTIALSVAGEQGNLPSDAVAATFERYWAEFVARRDGGKPWDAYTPYEWRNVGAFVRLGWRERAQELAAFFMRDRRPAAWNQWAEVVGRAPREPRFIGDMPHGWVASDFINAALDMLAYQRETDGALVLAAGIPASWLEGGGVRVEKLRTPYGPLTYSLSAAAGRTTLTYRLEGAPPVGGLVLAPPLGRERALPGSSGAIGFAADE